MIALCLAAFLFMGSFSASLRAEDELRTEDSRTGEKMVVDALIVRPLGILGTVAGTIVFVVSLPFSALGGNTEKAFQKLVAEPASYTFARPLGDL
jgi:hypothetical protein